LKDRGGVDSLLALLKDDSKLVKVAAALALADIGDKRAVTPLADAVASEKDEEAKEQMNEALKRLKAASD